MSNLLLDIKDLNIAFKNGSDYTQAVQHLDFQLNKGEILAIVGESGSGKTVSCLSLLQLLAGKETRIQSQKSLFHYDDKTISLHEADEPSIRKIRGKEISMIFQEPMTSLNPVFKCGNQVVEAIRLHLNYNKKEAKAYALSLFEKVKLPQPNRIFSSYPHQISGGQMQRVMIAMAIACQPKLLIADEPTTALDVTVQHAVLDLLLELKSEMNMSVLFISHDLGVVSKIADRVMVMQKGKKVEEGTTEMIFKTAKEAYTKGLIACRPPILKKPKRLLTVEDFTQNDTTPEIDYFSQAELEERKTTLESAETLLEIENLSKSYGSTTSFWKKSKAEEIIIAVNKVNLLVKHGETLGLVGESGCGKTTLGKAILQLIEVDNGDVIFKGQKLNSLSESELRPIRKDFQIIFQDPSSALNPKMTIGDSILEPMEIHKIGSKQERKTRMMELLELVGLSSSSYNRYPHQFSGGQKQRICIARALATNPKFIVCDESVSALDVSVQAQVLNLLIDLKAKFGFTTIFISHDLSVVKSISDRIAVMKDGAIVEYGFAEDVFNNPQQAYTKTLIAAIPQVPTHFK